VPLESEQEATRCGVPNADGGIFKPGSGNQELFIGCQIERGQPVVALEIGLPELSAAGQVNALDAVAVLKGIGTAKEQAPTIGRESGGAVMERIAVFGPMTAFDPGGREAHHADLVPQAGITSRVPGVDHGAGAIA
jgi:hypothetical protein